MKQLILREFRLIARTPLYWFCMIVAPLLSFVFFTTLMSAGLPTSMPIGLVDADNTKTTRAIARNLDAMQMSRISAQYPDVTAARRAVQRGEIYGFYYIPAGTTRKASHQDIPTVSFYTNYSYLVGASFIYREMRTMSELASASGLRSTLYARGATSRQAMAYLQPVVIDTHAVGNPWTNYNVYLNNTILPGILFLFVMLLTTYSIGMEVKRGTAREWYVLAGQNMLRALVGKLLPHTLIFSLIGVLYVVLLYGVLRFPCNAPMWQMMTAIVLGVMACQGFGAFMIGALPVTRMAMSMSSLWAVLSFSISGMSFPVQAMPAVFHYLSLLFPLRHYFLIYVNTALNGYSLLNVWPYVGALLVFAFVLPALVLRRMSRTLIPATYVP